MRRIVRIPHTNWDPTTRVDQLLSHTASPNDLFCGGTCALADGRAFLVGGEDVTVTVDSLKPTGTKAIYLFDPSTPALTLSPKTLQYKRWYSTPTLLSDGRVVIVGGVQQHGHPKSCSH
jgi:hypothetical protein